MIGIYTVAYNIASAEVMFRNSVCVCVCVGGGGGGGVAGLLLGCCSDLLGRVIFVNFRA